MEFIYAMLTSSTGGAGGTWSLRQNRNIVVGAYSRDTMKHQQIRDLLERTSDGADRHSTVAALGLIARSIQAGEIRHGHAAQFLASAMGYLLAGQSREAAWCGHQIAEGS